MSAEIVHLYECAHLPTALRNLAFNIEHGVYGDVDQATVLFPGAGEIFHMGTPPHDQNAGNAALANCACGVQKITKTIVEEMN